MFVAKKIHILSSCFPNSFTAAKCIALLFLAMAVAGTHAVDFVVTISANASDDGKRFDNDIGRSYAVQTMDAASKFIWQTFAQQSPTDRKDVRRVTLFVEKLKEIAYEFNNEVHLNSEYVAKYEGDVRNEITGLLYHEVTHVWQWNANGAAPVGLIEGIADYVRVSAGLAPPTWVKPGSGKQWDEVYDTTARFLQYCDTVTTGFVGQLNWKIRDGWDLGFFHDITGKSVNELWSDYKAKYGN